MKNNNVRFQHLGRIPYKEAWDLQLKLFNETLSAKLAGRPTANHLLFCEHPPVYTLGKSGKTQNLLLSPQQLQQRGIDFYRIERGGDITFHGPGQITGYPILDLDNFGLSIKDYIFGLEEVMIRVLEHYGLQGERSEGETGVWLDPDHPARARKIGAIGARISKLVTMHGFAFNVSTDLDFYNFIIPCGIRDKGVTSLEKELGKPVATEEVRQRLLEAFRQVYGMEFR